MRERWWRNVETLVTLADLGAWLGEARLLEAPASATSGQLRGARQRRGAIDAGILASTQSAPTPPPAIAEINRRLAYALPMQELVNCNGALTLGAQPPQDPVDHALHRIARDAATVLGASESWRFSARGRPAASVTWMEGK